MFLTHKCWTTCTPLPNNKDFFSKQDHHLPKLSCIVTHFCIQVSTPELHICFYFILFFRNTVHMMGKQKQKWK